MATRASDFKLPRGDGVGVGGAGDGNASAGAAAGAGIAVAWRWGGGGMDGRSGGCRELVAVAVPVAEVGYSTSGSARGQDPARKATRTSWTWL